MIDDNSLIEELKEIDTTLRNLGEYRKANMISMAIQIIEYCNRVKLSNKDKQIELMADELVGYGINPMFGKNTEEVIQYFEKLAKDSK